MAMRHHKGPAGEYYCSPHGYQIVQWGFVGLYEAKGPKGEDLGKHASVDDARQACQDDMSGVNGCWVI